MRSIDNGFYRTKLWRETQRAYMCSVDGVCERCLAKGQVVPARVVHHKIHLNSSNVLDASIAYGFDNLEALCSDCHNKEHFGESSKRYRIINGELVLLDASK